MNKIELVKIPDGNFEKYKALKVKEGQREGQFKIVTLTTDHNIKNLLIDCTSKDSAEFSMK